jgi:plastocyanin
VVRGPASAGRPTPALTDAPPHEHALTDAPPHEHARTPHSHTRRRATNAFGGFNFNGYGNGQMVITVHAGDTVTVIFTNNSTIPHSAVITAYSNRLSNSIMPPAFPGASTPDPTAGIVREVTQTFTFVASTVGTYAIVCGVPGHAQAGMWDVLKVT